MKNETFISIYVINENSYNASGEIRGEWLELPCFDESIIIETLKNIGIDIDYTQEDVRVGDTTTNIFGLDIGAYANISQLNEWAKKVSNLCDTELEGLEALLDYEFDYDEAMKKLEDGDIYVYNTSSMGEVAMDVLDNFGVLEHIPDYLKPYIDFSSFAEDLGSGCIDDCVDYIRSKYGNVVEIRY